MKSDLSLRNLAKPILLGVGASIAAWMTLSFYIPYSLEISAVVGGLAGAYYYRAPLKKGLIIGVFQAIVYVPLVLVLIDAFSTLGLITFTQPTIILSPGILLLLLPELLISIVGGVGGGAIGSALVAVMSRREAGKNPEMCNISPDAKVILREKTDSDLGEGELILTEKEVAYARPKFMGVEIVGTLPLDQITELGVQEEDLVVGSVRRTHEFGVTDPESWVKTIKEAMQKFVKVGAPEAPCPTPPDKLIQNGERK